MIWVLLLVMVVVQVSGLEVCADVVDVPGNCTMITPQISCVSYNYTILNQSGDVIESGNLSTYFGGVYSFNFVQDVGTYVVVLCDGGVRHIEVVEGENMIIAAIVLLPLLFGFLIMLGAWSLDGEEHSILKIFLFLLSFIMFYVSFHFGMIAVVKFFDFPELQLLIAKTVFWSWWMFGVIVIYWLVYGFVKVVHLAAQRKEERLRY